MSDINSNKRGLSSDESSHSDNENEELSKLHRNTKRKKQNDENSTFVSPEKIVDKEKRLCEFKTPEKIPFKSILRDETTPVKERTQTTDAGSPSSWSLSSNLSVCIDGDEDDLMSKVEQARRLISSANSSPDKGNNLTPKKNLVSVASPSTKLASSPKTPNKTRRVELITIASPKSKKM